MIRDPAPSERERVLSSIRMFVGFALEDGASARLIREVVEDEFRRRRGLREVELAAARRRVRRLSDAGFYESEAA